MLPYQNLSYTFVVTPRRRSYGAPSGEATILAYPVIVMRLDPTHHSKVTVQTSYLSSVNWNEDSTTLKTSKL